MFIFTTRFSMKRLFLLMLPVLIVAVVLLCFFYAPPTEDENVVILKNNEERIAYLQSLGWEITPEPLETLQLLLPETLTENYLAYNQIQLAQGLNLEPSCGKQLTRYTYAITNYPDHPRNVQLNLYICDNKLAAGDIIATGTNGFQCGLLYPSQRE